MIFKNLRVEFSLKIAHDCALDFRFIKDFFEGRWDCGAAAVAILLRASRLRRDKVTGNGWGRFWILDGRFWIQAKSVASGRVKFDAGAGVEHRLVQLPLHLGFRQGLGPIR